MTKADGLVFRCALASLYEGLSVHRLVTLSSKIREINIFEQLKACNRVIIQSFHHHEDASLALWALLYNVYVLPFLPIVLHFSHFLQPFDLDVLSAKNYTYTILMLLQFVLVLEWNWALVGCPNGALHVKNCSQHGWIEIQNRKNNVG